MNIQLTGYFDKNFGDDLMQLTAAGELKEHDIYVCGAQREMLEHLKSLPNIHIGKARGNAVLLNVTGTGFIYRSRTAMFSKFMEGMRSDRGIKRAVIGCSLEPDERISARLLINGTLRKYSYISCRDRSTYEYLKKNIRGAELNCSPDIVFAMRGMPERRGGEYLGIAPSRRTYLDVNYDYYKKLAAAADSYIDEYGKGVMLFAFDNGLENDFSACCSIRDMMKHRKSADIAVYNSDINDFLGRLAGCEMLITSRFHGVITALMLGIPVFSINDNRKLDLICEEFGIANEKRTGNGIELKKFITSRREPALLPDNIFRESRGHVEGLKQWLKSL